MGAALKSGMMRTDYDFDDRKVNLPNASTLGFGLYYAKRGNWLEWETDGRPGYGRSMGRVTCDGKVYIMVCALGLSLTCPMFRWVDPADVRVCNENPPKGIFDFICGDFSDPQRIADAIGNGFSQEMIYPK